MQPAGDKVRGVKGALAQRGVTGMTVSSVMGCGVQAGKTGKDALDNAK